MLIVLDFVVCVYLVIFWHLIDRCCMRKATSESLQLNSLCAYCFSDIFMFLKAFVFFFVVFMLTFFCSLNVFALRMIMVIF